MSLTGRRQTAPRIQNLGAPTIEGTLIKDALQSRELWVVVDGRTFIVTLSGSHEIRSIKERKVHQAGRPWECLYNAPYFHANHGKIGGPNTVTGKIAAAVQEKLDAEVIDYSALEARILGSTNV